MNPKNLSLHFSVFSVIFYAIYKNQENCNTIGDILLRGAPGKIWPFAMWPLSMAGGAGRPKSSGSGEGDGRERMWGGGGAHLGSI
jgi:hypothetical protein